MARGETRVSGLGDGEDVRRTEVALRALGVTIERSGGDARVLGLPRSAWSSPPDRLDCGNSGTTMRLLLGALAPCAFGVTLDGDASLRRRPMRRVAEPLARMGAVVITERTGRAPVYVRGGRLHGIAIDLEVASAQVKSALMLAALDAEGETVIRSPAASRDHTERMLRAMGAGLSTSTDGREVLVRPSQIVAPGRIDVAGDPSSAAFLIVAACVHPDAEIIIDDVLLNPTRTGFLSVLTAMGADVEATVEREVGGEPIGRVRARSSRMRGVVVSGDAVPTLIDEIPILALAAAFAEGRTEFRDAAELRAKESDRIARMAELLTAFGVHTETTEDTLCVEGASGRTLAASRSASDGDHRIAMTAAIGALVSDATCTIDDVDCVATSWPGFWTTLAVATA